MTTHQGDPALDLQIAYQMSSDFDGRSANQLFWAIDRLRHDHDQHGEGVRQNRFDATQRIATELDRRRVPLRDPRLPALYPGAIPN